MPAPTATNKDEPKPGQAVAAAPPSIIPQVIDDVFVVPVAPMPVERGEEPWTEDEGAVASPYAEVFFLHLREGHPHFERDIARAWMKKNAPNVPTQNLVDMIPLGALRRDSRIIVLARKGTSQEPISEAQPVIERNDQGHLIHRTIPASDLVHEMKAYCDIKVAQFWSNNRNRFAATDANFGALVGEIGKYAVPYTCKYEDSADDKSLRQRGFLYLGWC